MDLASEYFLLKPNFGYPNFDALTKTIIKLKPFKATKFSTIWFISPFSPVLHTEVTVSIGLKTSFRVGTSIPQNLDANVYYREWTKYFLEVRARFSRNKYKHLFNILNFPFQNFKVYVLKWKFQAISGPLHNNHLLYTQTMVFQSELIFSVLFPF